MLDIACVPLLEDNYGWLVHEPASGETVVVDPAIAAPVLEAAQERNWAITQIWATHWHGDHTGGIAQIKQATGCRVTGPHDPDHPIAELDRVVREGDDLRIGEIAGRVLSTPGHTRDHVAYHLPLPAMVFTGDTLFAMGCGRLFEGDAEQMFAALRRFAALPPDTRVYCGHEYTLANGRFALSVDPENQALVERMRVVSHLRSLDRPTLPATMGDELATNPFLRAASARELAELRALKDAFAG